MKEDTQGLIIQYEEIFNSHFPMFPLGTLEEDKLRGILTDCISQKKTVYDLGYLPDPSKDLERYY